MEHFKNPAKVPIRLHFINSNLQTIYSFSRTEFTLDESGDVSWKVPETAEPMPFFMCETYEVCN